MLAKMSLLVARTLVFYLFPKRRGGRGFLLTTAYLYCILHGKKVRACAPTGIAAANIELEGTGVSASTLHSFFDFDGSFESRLDFSKTTDETVSYTHLTLPTILLV